MTDEEIHEYLHKDFLTLGNTVFNRTDLFKSAVLKCRKFPMRRHYECKSIAAKTRFFVQMTATKRSDHKRPGYEFYAIYDRPEGLYCAKIYPREKETTFFPPHFFARYRERVTGENGMSAENLIHHFISRCWGMNFTLLPFEAQIDTAKWDQEIADEHYTFTAMCPDGLIFGEQRGPISIAKTIVTQRMLFDEQLDLYEDLYDDYMDMIFERFPEPVAEYIFALEADYNTQDTRLIDRSFEEMKSILRPSEDQLQDLKDKFNGR